MGLLRAGATAATGFAGLFTQEDNELSVAGDVAVAGSGPLGGLVPSGPQRFDTSTTSGLAGLASDGAVILNVDLSETVEISGNQVDLHIFGEVVTSGSVSPDGQSNEAFVWVEVGTGTGVQVPADAGPAVFPNPVRDLLHIQPGAPVTAVITDLLGREVFRRAIRGAARFEVDGLAPGLYYVRTIPAGPGRATVTPFVVLR